MPVFWSCLKKCPLVVTLAWFRIISLKFQNDIICCWTVYFNNNKASKITPTDEFWMRRRVLEPRYRHVKISVYSRAIVKITFLRGQKYFFDFRFGISVKFRVEWCIRLYDSYWICQYSLYFVHIHAYANTNLWESVGKFNMNHIVLYIIRREILRWFRIWSQKYIFAHAF